MVLEPHYLSMYTLSLGRTGDETSEKELKKQKFVFMLKEPFGQNHLGGGIIRLDIILQKKKFCCSKFKFNS